LRREVLPRMLSTVHTTCQPRLIRGFLEFLLDPVQRQMPAPINLRQSFDAEKGSVGFQALVATYGAALSQGLVCAKGVPVALSVNDRVRR
jgi:hypothetical protein